MHVKCTLNEGDGSLYLQSVSLALRRRAKSKVAVVEVACSGFENPSFSLFASLFLTIAGRVHIPHVVIESRTGRLCDMCLEGLCTFHDGIQYLSRVLSE